jgi:DNA-binding GntR family transcriptional regulator
VEKAVENLTEQGLAELRQRMESYGHDVYNRFTRDRLVYDQDVHLHIAQIAGNETLKKTLSHVFERIVLKRRTDGIYDAARGLTAHQEHVQLLDAMTRRDVKAAVSIVRNHIQAGKKNVVADLRQRQAIRELRPADLI